MASTLPCLAQVIGVDWHASRYYAAVEDPDAVGIFWRSNSPFTRLFTLLDLTAVLELAAGHGRHSAQIVDRATHLTVVDIDADNVAACAERFAAHPHVACLQTDGCTLPAPDGSLTAVFSYDSMVHFDSEIVLAYLRETARVLKRGGMALYHHSNYTGNPGGDYRDNPHWRNFMSCDLFAHYARKSGLGVVESALLTWGSNCCIDCLTLVLRPQ